MENLEDQQAMISEETNLVINRNSLTYLTEIRKWTMFFAVLGFIAIGLMVLAAFVVGIIASVGGAFGGFKEASVLGVLAVVYLAFGALYIFPVLYLLKFSTNTRKAIEQSDSNLLSSAFLNLKSHYKFVGILTIVIFGIYILVGVIAGIVALASVF